MLEEQKISSESMFLAESIHGSMPKNDMLPVLPLKNLVVLPTSIVPIIVGRKSSILAVETALKDYNKTIFITAQKNPDIEDPSIHDLFEYGTKATVLQVMKMPNDTLKILVEGISRVKVEQTVQTGSITTALCIPMPTEFNSIVDIEAAWRNLKNGYASYAKLNTKIPNDLVNAVETIHEKDIITDTIAVHTNISFLDRQKILETTDLVDRMILLCVLLKKEMDILKTEERIKGRVQHQVEKNQREYYLSEQIKAIHKELGRDDHLLEIEQLRQKIKTLHLPKDAFEKTNKELYRLEQMPSISAESAVTKNYIDWIISLPWNKQSKDTISLTKAELLLNKDHAGLIKVKERILEFVAAKKYAKDLKKSPTICLVGAPGVGKTSLARSIAECLGREFARIALGGVKDEAEIRGHRKTYIGAMPGKILHAMRKVKTVNPVILLDEIDKLSHDLTGDPAAALLEVLDPEQNRSFTDHFLETEYDLSQVMFIATANSIDSIPYALYDRMEIINVAGYTEIEKISIAQNFLIPKQLKEHNLKKQQIKIDQAIIKQIINEYTREAGVRQLERIFAKLMRKCIQEFLKDSTLKSIQITPEKILCWFGPEKFKKTELNKHENVPGIAMGLAWTELGGEVLEIEVSILPGKGSLTLTGQLGEIMQESAQAALSYVRSKAPLFGIKKSLFNEKDIHIHFPEAATPKDGSSAGITITCALVSALTEIPLKSNLAMTGEVSLRGRVLAIGGLKDKLLAAKQYHATTVILPKANESDYLEFKNEIDGLEIIFAEQMDFVLKTALTKDPFKKRNMKSKAESSVKENTKKKKRSKKKQKQT